jgi:hypothetical protein
MDGTAPIKSSVIGRRILHWTISRPYLTRSNLYLSVVNRAPSVADQPLKTVFLVNRTISGDTPTKHRTIREK